MNDKGDQRGAIMEANNLSYKFDDILNLSVNKTMKKQYFDTRTYTITSSGQQGVSTWNSGVDLIDLRNSYLKFNLNITGDGTYSFGSGSAMNLIKEIKILSSSGIELVRTQDANIFHKFNSRGRHSSNWYGTIGEMMGCQQTATEMNPATGYDFVIPLCELDPFFELYDGKLLPANVASGLRIEITWESLNSVLVRAAGTTTSNYIISNIEFRCDSVTLADSAMAVINKEASVNGLELTYDRIYTSSKNTGVNASENIEVRKAVSLAKGIFGICLPVLNRSDITLDSFISESWEFSGGHDCRLGNQYYNFQPTETLPESYFNYLKYYNKLKGYSNETLVDLQAFSATDSVMCATFETDDSLNLTGLPINSSRIVELRFNRVSGVALVDVRTYVFLTYTALARASLSNTSVKI